VLTGWLFNAFCRIIDPEVVVCIDTGTKPRRGSILKLWRAFYNDKDLGGCCGETQVHLGRRCSYIFKPLVASQNFEYKISCILDKPLEAVFGYLTVLPGAFSAYRFRAIVGDPLYRYFLGDPTLAHVLGKGGLQGMGAFRRNIFLAEDRILSFELVMKSGSKWHMDYIKQAKAETDTPISMTEFITQRRRWLNGAFAATIYSLINFYQLYRTRHSYIRMAFLHIQLLYNIISLTLAWFGIAGFLLTTFILTDISGSPPADSSISPFPFGSATPTINGIIQSIYLATVILQFIFALGNTPKCQVWSYLISFIIFGAIQGYFILNVIYLIIRVFQTGPIDGTGSDYNYIQTFYASLGDWTILIAAGSLFGVYYVASFLSLDPWHMFTSYPQYLFISSSYTNILNIYAFSNWHDVSWGVKAGKAPESIDVLPSVRLFKKQNTEGQSGNLYTFEDTELPEEDIDVRFEATVKRALVPYVAPKPHDTEPTVEESFKTFRTRLVVAYIFSNFMLCIFIMNDSFDKLKFLGDSEQHKIWFFKIWMWGTSITFIVRFLGCCWFLLSSVKVFFWRR
jgi:chitin synthase